MTRQAGRPAKGRQAPPPSQALGTLSRRLLMGFTLLGLGASAVSSYVHYRLLSQPGYTSFCDVNTTVNCTDVYMSRFGSFAGVPVALLGLLWFAAVLALLVAERNGSRTVRENVPGYVFALSTIGLAAVLYLGYASWVVLKAFCILCALVYVAVVALFVVSGAATSFPMSKLPGRAREDLRVLTRSPLGLSVAALLVVVAVGAFLFFPREGTTVAAAADTESAPATPLAQDQRSEFERWYSSQPRVDVPATAEPAKVVIFKFNDYQCPPCRSTWQQYKSVLAKYEAQGPGTLTFVTKDYPLDPECNANAPNGTHLAGCEAAVAVRLAREKGRADQMEAWLFANQESLSPDLVRRGVREVAGVEDFDARYASLLEAVRSDIALGGSLNVQATPTFFINGVKVQGGLQLQYFDAAIGYELNRAPALP